MFGTESMRLLRETWPNPTELAQELYAMFQDDISLTQKGPIKFEPAPGVTPIQVTLPNGSNPGNIIQWQQQPSGGGPTLPAPATGGIQFSSDGGTTYYSNYIDARVFEGGTYVTYNIAGDGSPNQNLLLVKAQQSGGGIPGQVLSGGPGPGPYQVKIYPGGLSAPPQTVSATVLQIAADDTVPVNSWHPILSVPNPSQQVGAPPKLYYFQPPVWQGDS